MSMTSRRYVLTRRAVATFDIRSMDLTTGDLSIDQLETQGYMRINGLQNVGIATTQEVGLEPARYPIKVVVTSNPDSVPNDLPITTVKYWMVANASKVVQNFHRRPDVEDSIIERYYTHCTGLDDVFWSNYAVTQGTAPEGEPDEVIGKLITHIYHTARLPILNDEHKQSILRNISHVAELCLEKKFPMYLKIGENSFMYAVPMGSTPPGYTGVTDDHLAILETLATIKVNYQRMKTRYEALESGSIVLAAAAIGSMFRYGLNECYEHREYYTAFCSYSATAPKSATVAKIVCPPGAAPPAGIAVGDKIDVSDVKLSSKVLDTSMGIIAAAGMNHYQYNHTTGGMQVTGPLLTILSMNSLISADTADSTSLDLTKLFYEALHPVNKRAIANIFFPTAKVYTYGKSAASRALNLMIADSFISIRNKPYPAGSHKAVICATVLRRVVKAHLTPFLPWVASLSECISHCEDILSAGARAHMGAHYYTGKQPISQSSVLDDYLPDLAVYIQTMAQYDTIAMSPHLSRDVAARANPNWSNLLKEIKSKDISSTSAETVKSYLASAGGILFELDPEKPETYASAIAKEQDAIQLLDKIL